MTSVILDSNISNSVKFTVSILDIDVVCLASNLDIKYLILPTSPTFTQHLDPFIMGTTRAYAFTGGFSICPHTTEMIRRDSNGAQIEVLT